MLLPYVGTLALLVVVADFQAHWYKDNKPIYWWWHTAWFLPFLMMPSALWFVDHNWKWSLILLASRMLLFSPILNLLRGETFFYIDGRSQYGSWIDKLFDNYEDIYIAFWFVGIGVYAAFTILWW